ncbi:MAG: hypothetical protein QOI10_224 [Solirubrobacterales bacterium]|nr:hypothetical protein [Solirubrobacterales bacterium]
MRRAFGGVLAVAVVLAAPGETAGEPSGRPHLAGGARIAAVRMYQGGVLVARRETAESIARTLARLRPTLVTAPLRYHVGDRIRPREISAWHTIRSAVRATSPRARFLVSLNALNYGRPRRVEAMMAKVRRRLEPDGWVFDFYSRAAARREAVMKAAVADANHHDETVGGNVFGIARDPSIPRGTDYVVVQGRDFHINLPAVRELAKRFPVYLQVGNDPRRPDSDGCRFIRELSTRERVAYVAQRARQQAKYHYRFAYPVFFPACVREDASSPGRGGVVAYNATREREMMRAIRRLMARYDEAGSS